MNAADAWDILATVFLPEQVRAWWKAPNKNLGMKTPWALWYRLHRRPEVIAEIRRITDNAW